jgi:hypothetical protein
MRQLLLGPIFVPLSLVGMLLMASTARPQLPEGIGRVTAIEGQATVFHHGQFSNESLAVETPVFRGDIIETAAASKIIITLTDATVISLGERSHLEVTQFLYDTRQQAHTARLHILSGVFRTIVSKLIPRSAFEVRTTTAVAAIRGTDLMGEVTADSTAIVVLDGTVMVSHARPSIGGQVTLTQGLGTTVKSHEPPSVPKKWSESRIEALRKATAIP